MEDNIQRKVSEYRVKKILAYFSKLCVLCRWPRICFDDQEGNDINWMERVSYRLKIKGQVREIVKRMSSLCYPERPEIHTPKDIMRTLTIGEYPHLEFVDDELTQLKFWPEKGL